MLENYFRPSLQRILFQPITNRLASYSINPNSVTGLALITGLVAAYCAAINHSVIASGLLLFSGLCDVIDGSLARKLELNNPIGIVYDILVDRVIEATIIIGLYFNDTTRATACIFMLATVLLCVTSFLVVGIISNNNSNKGFYYSPGIIERAEAFIFFFAMLLAPKLFSYLAYSFCLLVTLTTVIRVYECRKYII